jgi:5-methylcytosine-specific restriction endonuclease McrA
MGHPVSDKTRQAVSKRNTGFARHTMKHSAETRERLRFLNNERWYGPIKRYFGVTGKRGNTTFTKYQRINLIADKCLHCGSTEKLELDHITPWFAGGDQADSNAQTLCKKCNNAKHRDDLVKYTHLVVTREAV